MTIDSAIQHLKESLADPTHKCGCEECKTEHERLLEWLEDYKQLKADYIELDRRLRTANTEIDRLRSESGWIPCSERLPGRFDTVLLAILSKNGYGEPAYYVTIGGMKNGNEFESYTGDICECETVTHWMPLPSLSEVTTNSFSASSMSVGSA